MSTEEDGYVVRARGLPWSATPEDVVTFFSDSNILGGNEGVKFTYVPGGRPTGECFVTFHSQEDLKKALEKHKNHIGHRYIEVFQSKNKEMEWVTKRSGSDSKALEDNDGCVRLRGLPFDCTTEDIAEFFQGYEILADGITLPTDYDGRSTGEAFVQFTTKEIAEQALTKHKTNMGHRYIEIFRCNSQDVRRFNSNPMRFRQGGFGMNRPGPYDRSGPGMGGGPRGRSRNSGFERRYGGGYGGYGYDDDFNYGFGGYGGGYNSGRGGRGRGTSGPGRGGWGGGPQPLLPRGDFKRGYGAGMGGGAMSGGYGGGNTGGGGDFDTCTGFWIHMRGLPFKATEEDIGAFFGSTATPVNIKIHRVNGRANGEADADFESLEAAQAAMTKDKQEMGHRYIELFLNTNESSMGNSGGGSGFGSGRNAGSGSGGYSGGYSGGQSSYSSTSGTGGYSSNMGNMGGGYSSYGSGGGYGSQGMGTGGNQGNYYGGSTGGGGGTTGSGMGMGMNNSNNYGGGY